MSGPRRRRGSARPSSRRQRAPVRDFWGADSAEGHEATLIRPSDHPTALIESLGAPPLPGGEVAQHYFDAVYERAAALALALAASAGLSATSESTDPASGAVHGSPGAPRGRSSR